MSYLPSPAGFWKRYVAYFIDAVILYIVVELLSAVFFAFRAQSEFDSVMAMIRSLRSSQELGEVPDLQAMVQTLENVLLPSLVFSSTAYIVLAGVYFSVMESSRHQATLGKRMLGIKVTNANGAPIELSQSIARFVAAGLSWISLNLGHAFAAWTPERRALHDYIAGTRVENADPKNTAMPIWAWLIIAAHALIFIGSIFLMVFLMWFLMQQISAI
ncbi:MAG: RDD family protein [Arenimonas sp.]